MLLWLELEGHLRGDPRVRMAADVGRVQSFHSGGQSRPDIGCQLKDRIRREAYSHRRASTSGIAQGRKEVRQDDRDYPKKSHIPA